MSRSTDVVGRAQTQALPLLFVSLCSFLVSFACVQRRVVIVCPAFGLGCVGFVEAQHGIVFDSTRRAEDAAAAQQRKSPHKTFSSRVVFPFPSLHLPFFSSSPLSCFPHSHLAHTSFPTGCLPARLLHLTPNPSPIHPSIHPALPSPSFPPPTSLRPHTLPCPRCTLPRTGNQTLGAEQQTGCANTLLLS